MEFGMGTDRPFGYAARLQALRRGAEALLSARAHEMDEMEMMEVRGMGLSLVRCGSS